MLTLQRIADFLYRTTNVITGTDQLGETKHH